ncbi:hypothetical protein [Nitrobacter sp.]|jgi:hypothetical protein|uniref:hypothetical protein n=1 Tax=Nitrobacter sp. TaxID=29420 RepID=UPI003F649590
MGKIIEATAVISAQDKTGAVFDNIAKKFEGIAKAGKAFEGIKPPVLGKMGWGTNFQKEIDALKVSSKELAEIQRNWASFNSAMSRNGPVRAAQYFGAVDQWKKNTLSNLREVRLAMDETEKYHQKFFAGAGRFALHVAGIGGAAYMVGSAARAGVKASAERARELAKV